MLSLGANLRNVGLSLACFGSQTPFQNFHFISFTFRLGTQRTCYNINILSFGAHLESVSLSLAYSCACSELPKLTCLPVLSLTIKKAQKSQKHKVKGQVWIGLDGTSAFQCKSCTSFLLRWMKLNNTTDKKDVPKCWRTIKTCSFNRS